MSLALADELKDRGSESAYAKAMTTKSLLILVNTLKEGNAKERTEPDRRQHERS